MEFCPVPITSTLYAVSNADARINYLHVLWDWRRAMREPNIHHCHKSNSRLGISHLPLVGLSGSNSEFIPSCLRTKSFSIP
jgi:hypothetical protein